MKTTIPWLKKLAIVSVALFTIIMFFQLGRDYLYDWDEGIYGVIGKEMVQSGHLLTPTWNNELWLEKPPLIGWVSSLGILLAGENEFGVRLLMPIFAGLTLFAVYKIGEKLGGTILGTMSMSILGYFNMFLSRARTLNTDGMLLAAISWTAWLLLSDAPAWAVGLTMGFGVMAKGASGILAILISLPLLIKKSRSFLLTTFFYLLIIILPWHLYQLLINGSSFVTPYFLEQVLRRATVPIEFHTESRWFYFNFIFKDLGLGVILVSLLGLVFSLKKWLSKKTELSSILLIWWLLLPLALFTLAKTRLSWYILPVYPALALLAGYAISYFDTASKTRKIFLVLSLGMIMQMLFHAYQYVRPTLTNAPLSEILQVASSLKQYPGNKLAMLVSENERIAQAILPAREAISSSFRYGGAPSVVWYSDKHVNYYYNYDLFGADAINDEHITTLIVSEGDRAKVPSGYNEVIHVGNYLGYHRESNYAYR